MLAANGFRVGKAGLGNGPGEALRFVGLPYVVAERLTRDYVAIVSDGQVVAVKADRRRLLRGEPSIEPVCDVVIG